LTQISLICFGPAKQYIYCVISSQPRKSSQFFVEIRENLRAGKILFTLLNCLFDYKRNHRKKFFTFTLFLLKVLPLSSLIMILFFKQNRGLNANSERSQKKKK